MSKKKKEDEYYREAHAKYDIDKYRRKKKRKKLYMYMLIGLLVLIVLTAIFFIVETVMQNSKAAQENKGTFPISIKGEEPFELSVVKRDLLVTGGSKMIFYQMDAEKDGEIVHGLANPVVKTSKDRVLSYDEGGYVVRLDNKNGNVSTLKTQTQILFCEISDDGYIAVATFEERFNAAITIYNDDFDQLYKYNESKYYVTGFDFISKQKGVLVMQTTTGAELSSVIYGLDFTKDENTEYFQKTLDGEIVYSAESKSNGNIGLVTANGFILLDKNGEEIQRHSYTNTVRFISDEQSDTVLALENIIDSSDTDVFVWSADGEELGSVTIPATVIDIFCDEEGILILDKNSIYVYDYSLNLLSTLENSDNCVEVARLAGDIYGMNSDYLYQYGR